MYVVQGLAIHYLLALVQTASYLTVCLCFELAATNHGNRCFLIMHRRGNNGATMPGADDAFPAESRTTVFFGAVTSKSEPLTFQESLRFVKKVKARNYMLYLSLFDILGRTELSQLEAYQTLQLLFRDHPDLHEGLEKFRPPMPAKHAAANSNLWPWVFACAAVPLVAMSLIPALGNPVLWLVQQTLGEKMRAA
ncbi:hypothetical protein VPH35_057091 [Triticum aestivum]